MKTIYLFVLFFTPVFLIAQSKMYKVDALVTPKTVKNIITIGGANADISGYTNQSIQFAIDAVAKTGGTVKLNPGIFEIIAPVRMKSNVKLFGSGKETTLKRGAGAQTNYVVDADNGELK